MPPKPSITLRAAAGLALERDNFVKPGLDELDAPGPGSLRRIRGAVHLDASPKAVQRAKDESDAGRGAAPYFFSVFR